MISSSFLFFAFGIQGFQCNSFGYKDSQIVLNIQKRSDKMCCPHCKSRHIVRNGYVWRDFKTVPIGHTPVVLHTKIQRVKCKRCGCDQQEAIHFAHGKRTYTARLENLVMDLLDIATIKSVAEYLHLAWDTVKDIHKRRLRARYKNPDIRGVRNIGIDEFAVRKGHVYKTIVVDLDTGRIIHVGEGKGADALKGFWLKVDHYGVVIEHIATDLSKAFIASVMENAPVAVHVFDHFHVVKLMNEAIDKLRSRMYHDEKDVNRRKVIKGMRWLLLCNGKDIYDDKHRERLENALSMNKPLAQAYYLKESMREIWMQVSKSKAAIVIDDWICQARSTKVPLIEKVANTIAAYRYGILAWYDCHISTAKVEGINNKIKVLKRNAYGFRDEQYFNLRLYALHERNVTSFV